MRSSGLIAKGCFAISASSSRYRFTGATGTRGADTAWNTGNRKRELHRQIPETNAGECKEPRHAAALHSTSCLTVFFVVCVERTKAATDTTETAAKSTDSLMFSDEMLAVINTRPNESMSPQAFLQSEVQDTDLPSRIYFVIYCKLMH